MPIEGWIPPSGQTVTKIPHNSTERRSDGGYALVNAIWILTLAAGIAALMMARAVRESQILAFDHRQFNAENMIANTREASLADLWFDAGEVQALQTGAFVQYRFGKMVGRVKISSESERIDLNEGDLGALDALMATDGIIATQRQALLAALAEYRHAHQRIETLAAARALMDNIGISPMSADCLIDSATISSNLTVPLPRSGDLRRDAPLRLDIIVPNRARQIFITLPNLQPGTYGYVIEHLATACPVENM